MPYFENDWRLTHRVPGTNQKKNNLINSILRCGLTPEIRVFAEIKGTCKVDAYMMAQLELNYIRDMFKEGHPLVNVFGIKNSTYYNWQTYLRNQENGIFDVTFYESFMWRGVQFHDLVSIDQDRKKGYKMPKEGSLAFYLKYGESRYAIAGEDGEKLWEDAELKMI